MLGRMLSVVKKLESYPVAVRVLPFGVFLGLTALQDQFGEAGRYWVYLGKTLAGGALLWGLRPLISEMRWACSAAAIATGVGVFLLWVGLDGLYPTLGGSKSAWNPLAFFGAHSVLAWLFVGVRLFGSVVVVPPLEEVFFRSWIYRYLARKDFLSVPLGRFLPLPFFATSVLFGLEHREWLAGILCGGLYQALVIWKGRLGDAIAAHALTNLLLGLWVMSRNAWQFW